MYRAREPAICTPSGRRWAPGSPPPPRASGEHIYALAAWPRRTRLSHPRPPRGAVARRRARTRRRGRRSSVDERRRDGECERVPDLPPVKIVSSESKKSQVAAAVVIGIWPMGSLCRANWVRAVGRYQKGAGAVRRAWSDMKQDRAVGGATNYGCDNMYRQRVAASVMIVADVRWSVSFAIAIKRRLLYCGRRTYGNLRERSRLSKKFGMYALGNS